MKKRKIMIGAVLLLAAAGITIGIVNTRGRRKLAEATVKQSTISLSKMDLVKSVSATGTIESRKTKSVTASVKEIDIGKVLVSVGDTIKKGDPLVTFDKSALEDALEEAQESLADARSDADREISSARKQLSSALETRNEEKNRQESKVAEAKKEKKAAAKAAARAKKKAASAKNAQEKTARQEELAKAQEALKQAETAYENAVENRTNTNKQNEASVENARTSLENTQSNAGKSVKQAGRQVEAAQQSLEKCSVTAPISGVVTAVNVEEGDSYSGGTLLQIDDTSSFVVTTSVDEYDISNVEVGQKAVILTEATDEDELEGEITFVAPSIETASGSQSQDGGMSSGSDGYEVSIAVKTKDERLKLGMTAKCSIVMEEAEDVFAVPYDAVHEKSDGTYVIYVAEDSTSEAESRSDSSGSDGKMNGYVGGGNDGEGPESGESSSEGNGERPESGESSGEGPEAGENSSERNGERPDFGEGRGEWGGKRLDFENEREDVQSSDEAGDQAETGSQREIVVTKGLESDYYVEISGDDLYEGMRVIIPTDETTDSSDKDKSQGNSLPIFGGVAGDGAMRKDWQGNGDRGGMGGNTGGRQ